VQVYAFYVRCISGEWQDAVSLEMERMQKKFPNLTQAQQVLKSRFALIRLGVNAGRPMHPTVFLLFA